MSVRAGAYGQYASVRVNRRPRAVDSVHVPRGPVLGAPSPRSNAHVHRAHRDGRRSDILSPRDSPLGGSTSAAGSNHVARARPSTTAASTFRNRTAIAQAIALALWGLDG